MSPKGVKKTQLVFIERLEPDPRRVENGLAVLGRMIAQAMVRDAPNSEFSPGAEQEPSESAEAPLPDGKDSKEVR